MASIDQSGAGVRKETSIADLIVKGAIALVTAAIFIGAYLQFQVTFWLSLIAALATYITLLMLHALMRRSERVDVLASEVNRLESELARFKSQDDYIPPARGPQPRPQAPHGQGLGSQGAGSGRQPTVRTLQESELEPSLDAPPAYGDRLVGSSARPGSGPVTSAPPLGPAGAYGEPYLEGLAASAPGKAGADGMHDYWSFRPSKPATAAEAPSAAPAGPAATPAPPAMAPAGPTPRRALGAMSGASGPGAPGTGERENDLEAVQGMIKRLADELSVGAEAPGQGPAGEVAPERAIHASVNALHTTAETMRAAAGKAPPAPSRERAPSTPPPIGASHGRLSAIGAAISAGRIDVLLRSIIGLADHKVHHYELIVSPRDEKGASITVGAHDLQLVRTGLHPLLDTARLSRASRICRSLAEAGQRQCVFSPASGESLANDRFLDELASNYRAREALAGELVLAFSYADVKMFGSAEWAALTDMRDLGFRFATEDVSDLDYEFTALRAAGFAFVKIDGSRFSHGLPGPNGVIPAKDVCRQLTEIGLAVVAGAVRDDAMRVSITEAGVPLAEGPFFGPPRPVAADLFAAPGSTAAA
jgi:EAL domain-containing protein (putative c-di-GMP-specific phosphodiesterase class I)